jgi:hypothetical protein
MAKPWQIDEALWKRIESLLPVHRPGDDLVFTVVETHPVTQAQHRRAGESEDLVVAALETHPVPGRSTARDGTPVMPPARRTWQGAEAPTGPQPAPAATAGDIAPAAPRPGHLRLRRRPSTGQAQRTRPAAPQPPAGRRSAGAGTPTATAGSPSRSGPERRPAGTPSRPDRMPGGSPRTRPGPGDRACPPADSHRHGRATATLSEVVRHVRPGLAFFGCSPQPERLGGSPRHSPVPAEPHQLVALQPRFIADVAAIGSRPPAPGRCRCPLRVRMRRVGCVSANRTTAASASGTRC